MYQPSSMASRSETRGSQQLTDTTGTADGETLVADAAANTKGTYVALDGGTTSFAYEAMTLCIGDCGPSSAADYLLDLAIENTTDGTRLIQDLRIPNRVNNAANEVTFRYYVPVHVPSGSTLYARVQGSAGSGDTKITVVGHSAGLGGAPGFSRLIPLNAFATSRGVAVDSGDPAGTANDEGIWTELVASSAVACGGMLIVVGGNADTIRAATSWLLGIGVGASTAEYQIVPEIFIHAGATRDAPADIIGPFACNISAGSRVVARLRCSVATAGDRLIDVSVYALVP